MNRLAIGVGALAILAGTAHALIGSSLQKQLSTARADQRLPVHIVLTQQFNSQLLRSAVDGMTRPARRVEVARILQEFSREQQAGLLAYLERQVVAGVVANVKSLWIVNVVCCEATPAVIQALEQRPEVYYVNYDLVELAEDSVESGPAGEGVEPLPAGDDEEIAWGVNTIHAPQVWAQGYTGQGVVVAVIDYALNYNHSDLADHMWTDPNYLHHGWDFMNNDDNPYFLSGHGNWVAGVLAGDGTGDTHTGVAPDAQIMVCAVDNMGSTEIGLASQCWQAIQFCVSPPDSPWHGADLYTIAVGIYSLSDLDLATWRTLAVNVNAAGLSQISACGNQRGSGHPPYALT